MAQPATPMEIDRGAAAIDAPLRKKANASGALTQWWDLPRYEPLGDRTRNEARLADDHDLVEKLVTG